MCGSISLHPRKTGVREDPRVVPRRPRRSDETTTEREHAGVSPSVTRREFERQTRTLRKPEECDSFWIDALLAKRLEETRQHTDRRADPRLVLLRRRQERVG